MADEHTTPDAVVKIRPSEHQRSVAVGAFGRSFDTIGGQSGTARAIKAVWRNETGPCSGASSETETP
ncbi:hypothetical protein [Sulfitobacter sp. SK011]|uniref:hypothetical protein n=1 Tax=Sulfitobacter sp. SK011 TaxID=1389004 RepID=UPI000E0C84DE|nr:hypothetical protein [Sulfitobacter sp. SK011]AXI42380.1 hypothetical protein C1J02_10840 [Sulfitobacter sp. SK011]